MDNQPSVGSYCTGFLGLMASCIDVSCKGTHVLSLGALFNCHIQTNYNPLGGGVFNVVCSAFIHSYLRQQDKSFSKTWSYAIGNFFVVGHKTAQILCLLVTFHRWSPFSSGYQRKLHLSIMQINWKWGSHSFQRVSQNNLQLHSLDVIVLTYSVPAVLLFFWRTCNICVMYVLVYKHGKCIISTVLHFLFLECFSNRTWTICEFQLLNATWKHLPLLCEYCISMVFY